MKEMGSKSAEKVKEKEGRRSKRRQERREMHLMMIMICFTGKPIIGVQ